MALQLQENALSRRLESAHRCALKWSRWCSAKLRNAFRLPEPTTPWPAILSALFVSLVCMTVPTVPSYFHPDASWSAVLNWAHTRGSQFGTDIIFTYGPLGYLLAPYCLEPPSNALIWINAALSFQIALGLCLLAWRLALVWRLLLLLFFVIESANAEFRADLLLEVGILCWGLLCILGSGRRQKICAVGFIALAAFAALTKVVYLFVAGFSVTALTVYFAANGHRNMSRALIPGFVVTFLILWLVCGQALLHLPSFIRNAFMISREYDQAVALEGLQTLRFWGVILGFVCLTGLLLRVGGAFGPDDKRLLWRRAALLLWTTGLLLLVWKHSLVRMDRQHFFDLAIFGPVAVLALEALPGPATPTRRLAQVVSLTATLISFVTVQSAFLQGLGPSISQVVAEFASHTQWISSPTAFRALLEPDLMARKQEVRLPNLRKSLDNATVDVFGLNQSHALLNGLNYTPRPVFQSYVAYNPELARLNELYYLASNAPAYVLFELAGLEHRFASLDDTLALRTILSDYRPVASENGFLLLKRCALEPSKITLLKDGVVNLGSPLDLSRFGETNIWIELDVQPSWEGRLLRLFYHTPPIRLSVWGSSSNDLRRIARRQVAPSILKAGFIASPFFLNTQAVSDFYEDQPGLRPAALSIEPAEGTERLWKSAVGYRLYRIEKRIQQTPPDN